MSTGLIPIGRIEKSILLMRGQKVILDKDIARLYQVTTKRLMQAVTRNLERFPDDFMLQLTWDETRKIQHLLLKSSVISDSCSRSQIVTLKKGSNIKHRPHVFTEHGVAMLSSVLRSKRAIQVNIEIMRTFSKLRRILESNKELAEKISDMESKYDAQFKVVFDAIRQLMTPPDKPKRRIGFGEEY